MREVPALVCGTHVMSRAALLGSFLSRCAHGPSADWGPHLVVVPASTLEAFLLAFKQHCPSLETVSLLGDAHARARRVSKVACRTPMGVHVECSGLKEAARAARYEHGGNRTGWGSVENLSKPFNVCVASFEAVLDHRASLCRQRWSCLAFDEPGYVQGWSEALSSSSSSSLSSSALSSSSSESVYDVAQIMHTSSARYRVVMASAESARQMLAAAQDKAQTAGANLLAEVVMMLLPSAIVSFKKIGEWCQRSFGKKSGKSTSARDFLRSISVSIDDASSMAADSVRERVTYTLCGCRAPVAQMSSYTRTAEHIGKRLLVQSGEDLSSYVDGSKENSPVEIESSLTPQELARLVCQLHSASVHSELGQGRRRAGPLSACMTALPHVPRWAWSVLKRDWSQNVNLDVLNLCILDTELGHRSAKVECYNFEATVSAVSVSSMAIRALRECKFSLLCVEASVHERDDGGPLAEFSQMVHAKKLRSTEHLFNHRIYLNHLRCRRISPYAGCIRVLQRMLGGHGSFQNMKKSGLATRKRDVFNCAKPRVMGGLWCQGHSSSSSFG